MTWKPLSSRFFLLFMAPLLVATASFSAPTGADKEKLIKEFVAKADHEYQAAIDRAAKMHTPGLTETFQKAKTIFDEGSKSYLHNPPYQNWEFDYVKDSVQNNLRGLGQMIDVTRNAQKNNETAGEISAHIDHIRQEESFNALSIENRYRALVAQGAGGHLPQQAQGGLGKGIGNAVSPAGPDGAGDAAANADAMESPNDQWQTHRNDFDKSEVVKLQKHTIQELRHSGGGGGGGPFGPVPAHGGSGGGSSTGGATPNSGSTADPSSGGYGDVLQAIAAKSLTSAGADALDGGRYAEALSNARGALALDPSNQAAMMILHSAQGRDGSAAGGPTSSAAAGGAGGAERGFSGGAEGGGARASFASASRAGGVAESNAAASRLSGEQALKESRNALGLNDLSGAMAYVNRALAQNPNDPALLNLRASIYARMGQYAKAAADAKQGLLFAPRNAALMRTLAYSQVRGKDYKDALASANSLIELDPQDAYGYALRGHAYGSLGDRDAMLADLKRAAQLDPRFQATLAQVQLPSDSDVLFLFPGEAPPSGTAGTAAPSGGRARKFGLIAGAAVFGGLLLAIGLLQTVLAPLKQRVTSVFTRLTRTGPSVASLADPATAQPASVNGLMPGLIRGQYEINRQIGQGGMGTVFEGTDRSLGRRVAIKKMRDELRVNPQERARFVIEAKTVAALHHPNIVDIYAIAEDGQDVYLIFEYVDGQTAHDLVQRSGRLPIAEAARVVRASADALGYAHARGVIHRDMKPSNVMLDAQGRVKVMDFGIARMAKDSATRYSMTNTVVGTPPYMAPEQEQGQVRKESDVYALAVCAYEMLTGKLPFIGIGAGMLMNKINMSYIAPSRAIAGLPETLDEVFKKAFQSDPDKRYRTPGEFADALEASLGSGVRA